MDQDLALAEPISIGRHTVRNRLVATAHGIAAVTDGMPNADDAAYWARLSAGGVGMTIAGGVQVAPESVLRSRYLTEAYRAEAVVGMRRRAQAMKSGGAVAVIQLGHLGQETLGASSFYPFVAASDVRSPREPVASRVLSLDEIPDVVDAFQLSAAHSAEAGFDVIEIHAAHGYLIAQFLSSKYNTRTDRYGGGPEGRVTLLAEIVEAIRRVAGDAAVGVRLSAAPEANSGLGVEELLDLVSRLQQRAPVDYLNLSYGVRGYYVRDMATTAPPLLETGRLFRDVLDVPLLLCSGFRDLDTIETAIRTGAADLVGMARQYIADPDLPNKFLTGKADLVRPCVACNEDCRVFNPTALCTVNPDLAPPGFSRRPARPVLIGPVRRGAPRAVVVVGAGPAGLETALTLAENGVTDVQIFEATSEIGGQVRVAGLGADRKGWQRLLAYYDRRLRALGVSVKTGTRADVETLNGFDEIVWAAGAIERSASLTPRTGTALSASTYLQTSSDSAGSAVVVADDGFGWWPTVSAVETALARGAEVTLVTPSGDFALGIPAESRLQLVERLAGAKLQVIPLHQVEFNASGDLIAVNVLSGAATPIPSSVVVQVGQRESVVAKAVAGKRIWSIGDALTPRRVSHAIAEGREVGIRIAQSRLRAAGSVQSMGSK